MRRFAAIPAHPQKQYTRRWRLYHFCGFYYPIREVIPIAIYHWNIGIVSRGKGKSAVAAAAYRSGEKLTNEWDGMTHDYTRKGGVVHTEIMLPPHAPPSFSDRSTLWNSVELYEKAGNAQLAREIDAALPIELSREEQIRLVREYCSSQFVSRGMCVDFVIHDTNSGNPHCHIMLTMRPLDERGTWTAKSKKEYDLDENGERIRLPSGRYKTHKVDLTGWNDKDNTLLWRKTDMNRANEVRPMFRRLADVAERTGCAVILIGHLNKATGGQSAYRGLGSIDFRAAARSVLLIGRVKREPNVRVIVHDKSSLAPEGKPVAFCLDPETGFSWIGEYDITADELLSGAGGNNATKTEQAERLILDLLADGKELASEDIVKAAAEAGISERTVQNAKRNMGGILGARRVGGQWYNFIKKKQPPEPAS